MAALLALTLLPAAFSYGQAVNRVGPPPAVVERPGPPPEREFVWVGGYHRWDGACCVWVPGRWDRPPHPHLHWVAAHYVQHHGGWVFVEGIGASARQECHTRRSALAPLLLSGTACGTKDIRLCASQLENGLYDGRARRRNERA